MKKYSTKQYDKYDKTISIRIPNQTLKKVTEFAEKKALSRNKAIVILLNQNFS